MTFESWLGPHQACRELTAGLVVFDLDVQIAGMLHDVIEASDLTLDDARAHGVSQRSLAAFSHHV